MLHQWRQRGRHLKREAFVLWLACRHPGVPWAARLVIVGVIAYAMSPIDLIPDFVPVLGQIDDLLLVPLGLALALRLIPPPVMAACRQEAERAPAAGGPMPRGIATVVAGIWLLLAAAGLALVIQLDQ